MELARQALNKWVTYYNDVRPHGSCDGETPTGYEMKLAATTQERAEVKRRKPIPFYGPLEKRHRTRVEKNATAPKGKTGKA